MSTLHMINQTCAKILESFASCLLKPTEIEAIAKSYTKFEKIDYSKLEFLLNPNECLEKLTNYIDFESPITNSKFSVDIEKISQTEKELTKELLSELCQLTQKYVLFVCKTIEAFKLLDPKNRNINNSIFNFRMVL